MNTSCPIAVASVLCLVMGDYTMQTPLFHRVKPRKFTYSIYAPMESSAKYKSMIY